MNIIAIKRKEHFSPNHIGNDTAILNAVCTALIAGGVEVRSCEEEEFLAQVDFPYDIVLNMGRSQQVLSKLQMLEDAGKPVVNSAYGVVQCFRKNMTLALLKNNVPYPRSIIVDTASDVSWAVKELDGEAIWIKRGDFHAIHREDVSFASSLDQAQSIVEEYALRGIPEAVLSVHLPGDLVKFYAVRGTDFFYWFYPYEHNHHKYAVYEQINGLTLHYPFDIEALRAAATQAATVLGVIVYGGDAIIAADGTFQIIDLNDWPSFAPCREEAGLAIANFLLTAY